MLDDPFFAAVLANPGDDAQRLVYADWLEERGDPRAEFLRLDCQFVKLGPTDKRSPALLKRLRELQAALDPDWVALVRRAPVQDTIEAALEALEALLPGLNYQVFLGAYRVPGWRGPAPEPYISAAFGPRAAVGGASAATGAELLAEVETCLRYPGDDGHGPDPSALRSPEFNRLVRAVLKYLGQSAGEATAITSFWLPLEGHPFYPVMWGFGYVLVKRHYAVVLLGASSD